MQMMDASGRSVSRITSINGDTPPSHIDGGHGYSVHLHSFFDNSRDEEPNYLVGPSDRLGSRAATSSSVETTSALSSDAVTSKLDPLVPALPQVNEWAVTR